MNPIDKHRNEVSEHLKKLKNHPRIWSVDYSSYSKVTTNHLEDDLSRRIKKFNHESISIWVDIIDSADKIRNFISWLGFSLECDSWKKSIGDSVWYYGTYKGIDVSVNVKVPSKPLKKITVLQDLSGCELVERYSTHTSKSYVCETR